ncbi:MAG: hypothetical protein ACXWDO_00295, partial [Bacteroidia bacterium]
KSILSLYNIKSSRIDDRDAKKGLSVKLATGSKLSAEVDAGHIPVNLVNVAGIKTTREEVGRKVSFASSIKTRKTRSVKGGKVYRTAISVEITKGTRTTLRTAFIVNKFKSQGGSTVNIAGGAIFARGKRGKPTFEHGRSRMPIDSLSTVSVSTAANNTKAQENVMPVVSSVYVKELERQLKRRLDA